MDTNTLPFYDAGDNPTGCCPRFKPEGWDEQALHFENKPFVRAETRSIFHIPINMKAVFARTFEAIEKAGAVDAEQFIVLSNDLSPWKSEHLFSVTSEVPGVDMVELSGEFLTRVFEGPYRKAPVWYRDMEEFVRGQGKGLKRIYFFYTTCPKCAKFYGKNYVVGVAQLA